MTIEEIRLKGFWLNLEDKPVKLKNMTALENSLEDLRQQYAAAKKSFLKCGCTVYSEKMASLQVKITDLENTLKKV